MDLFTAHFPTVRGKRDVHYNDRREKFVFQFHGTVSLLIFWSYIKYYDGFIQKIQVNKDETLWFIILPIIKLPLDLEGYIVERRKYVDLFQDIGKKNTDLNEVCKFYQLKSAAMCMNQHWICLKYSRHSGLHLLHGYYGFI
jgi:hypothetical protein